MPHSYRRAIDAALAEVPIRTVVLTAEMGGSSTSAVEAMDARGPRRPASRDRRRRPKP
jgi:hypothetical protein